MPSVFLSYSHKDEVWKDRLKTHLGVLEKQGLLETWDDRRIGAGADWFEEIQEAMARASVAVLLISANFLTSDFILSEEVPKLFERRKREGLPVIPIIVHACAWDEVEWLPRVQARPRDGRALESFRGRLNQELTKIAKEILKILRDAEARQDREPPGRGGEFLDLVEAVCRLREPEAEIRRLPGIGAAGGYLRIGRKVGPFREIYPVGAIEHGLSREILRAFLDEIDAHYRKNNRVLISHLVYGGPPAPAELLAEAHSRQVYLQSFVEYQGLIDFRTYLASQTAKLAADPIYPPWLYVEQRMRTISLVGAEEEEVEDALAQAQEWLASPHGRFLVLLGDFGTGKTFLLHELARRMGQADAGLVPILLQMRSLEKGRSLDALIGQHFGQERMDIAIEKFRYMLEQGRIALLFDGFDELALRVTYSKAADHFETLLQAAGGNAKVVLTSRRQHFLSENQVKTALAEKVESLSGHRLTILQPFRREQIRRFLVNFFEGDEEKAAARLDLIDRVKDLLGLSSNPRLLSFIAELSGGELVQACTEGGEITAAKLYQILLNRWLVLEFDRVHPRGAPPGLSVEERWQAVTLLAMKLWQKTDRFVGLSELTEQAAKVVQAVGPAAPDSEVAAFQLGSGTLLVRDDEGNFSFLHQSILEWLVAKSAAETLKKGDPEALAAREMSPLMADFFADLAGREQAIGWARSVLLAPGGLVAKKNALLLLDRQKEIDRRSFNLIDLDLRGKDLSAKDLSGADLSGADLTAARLVGTRLASAKLVKAMLREADLSQALLTGADLAGADLTDARLVGADLRGAHLKQACLRRTKLLGVDLDTGAFEMSDTFGAAWSHLGDLGVQMHAKGACQAVAWSPDGELLAGAQENSIFIWNVNSGREIRALVGHQSGVFSVAFSPDGKTLASASDDNTVRLWQIDTGTKIRALTSHQKKVRNVAFSPDGKTLASASEDNTVRLWQVDTGTKIRALTGHQSGVWSVAFSPDGKTLASGSGDKTVRLWQVDTGIKISALTGHQNTVLSVAFSPDGKTLASGSGDKTVRLWQVDTGTKISALTGHQKEVRSVAFSPDGKTLASGSGDNTIRLWQVDTGTKISALTGHQYWIRSVAFSPDGKTLASASGDNTVRLWQVDTGTEISALTGHKNGVRSVAFSPDGKILASASFDNTVRLWQVDTGTKISALTGHQDGVRSVAFSPDGKTLASGSDDKTVRLWQMDTGTEISALTGHQYWIRSVAFSPDGKTLASADDNTVRLWQVDTGTEISALTGHKNMIGSVAFSPDGKTLASGSEDKTVRLWQVDTGTEIGALAGHKNGVWGVAFSPDGKTLASASYDNTVRLWQVNTGTEIRALTGHQNWVWSVAFSPDGKILASASGDQTVRLWKVDSGSEIRTLTGHQNAVWSVAFHPDGKSLASASYDGTIRLWDVATGRCLVVLLPLPEGWAAFSPDGRYKFGGVPAGGFWHAISLCRFEPGELDEWIPGLRLADDASFFDLPDWKPEVRGVSPAARPREAPRETAEPL